MSATTACPTNVTRYLWETEMYSWCGSNASGVCTNSGAGHLFIVGLANVSVIAGQNSATSTIPVPASSSNATSISSSSTRTCAAGMVPLAVPIGVGAGLALPFALLSVLFGTLFFRERKRRIAAQAASSYGNSQRDTSHGVFLSGIKPPDQHGPPAELFAGQSPFISHRG